MRCSCRRLPSSIAIMIGSTRECTRVLFDFGRVGAKRTFRVGCSIFAGLAGESRPQILIASRLFPHVSLTRLWPVLASVQCLDTPLSTSRHIYRSFAPHLWGLSILAGLSGISHWRGYGS